MSHYSLRFLLFVSHPFLRKNQMNHFEKLCVVVVLWLAVGAGWGAEPVLIVDPAAGTPAARTGKTLDFAAQELSRYLKTVTGENYPVVHGTDCGAPATARLVVDPGFQEEEYCVRRVGSAVEISGGSPRGCLYGAYRFLQELGCRWPLPGKANEVVPRRTEINWSEPEIRSRPAFKRRGLQWALADSPDMYDEETLNDLMDYVDYLAKNGFNYVSIHQEPIPPDYLAKLDEAVRARDLIVDWGGHLLSDYLPRSEFDKHPEYFRMKNGKRTASLNMCPSSSGAADIVAKNSLAELRRLKTLPHFETLHLWPDDLYSGGLCGCPQCSKLSASDQALQIINAVAERLPLGQTALAHLSYHATVELPRKVKPHPNVRLYYAPRERCYRHVMGECPVNQRYLAWLKPQVGLFPNDPEVMEYYLDMWMFRHLPLPLHRVIGRDVKVYHEAGIKRLNALYFTRFSDWAYGMNFYVFGKALWRGEGAPEDIKEYCQAVYGPAAVPMEQYFDRLFELCGTVISVQNCGDEGLADLHRPAYLAHLAPLITKEHLDEIESIVTKAASTAEEPYRSRIDQQIILWKFARLDIRAQFNRLVVAQRMKDFGMGRLKEEDRLHTITLTKEIIANSSKAERILVSAPMRLRGPWSAPRLSVSTDRPVAKAWLKELEQPPAQP